MRKKILITFLLSTMTLVGFATNLTNVECGTWVEMWAKPYPDFHFVKWSDGNTDSIRQIQVNESRTYVAYFAPNCEEYANLPIVQLYDWLLMLDVHSIKQKGYYLSEQNVSWYRVVGQIDDMHEDNTIQPDEKVCTGFYLTIDRNLYGTGDYYAIVDVSSSPSGALCSGLMRSVIAHYATPKDKQHAFLVPTHTTAGEQIELRNLYPDENTLIQVFDMVGRLVETHTSMGESSFMMTASKVAGCYNVLVSSESEKTTLRYIVNSK